MSAPARPSEVRHENAWRIDADHADEYGVLVQCGQPEHPYWWLLCPAAATLYLYPESDLRDCSDVTCLWTDVHEAAHRLQRALLPAAPVGDDRQDTQ